MRVIPWALFYLFLAIAVYLNWCPELLRVGTGVEITRLILIAAWLGFLGFSHYCSQRENIFRTVNTMLTYFWGRQIGIDLYISVSLSLGLVYLVTGSFAETLLWSIAFIPFANLAILPFIILHLHEISAAFGL
ncbi:MAG: hypothetical protein AAGC77_13905 [Pseudomonadota bacterium]